MSKQQTPQAEALEIPPPYVNCTPEQWAEAKRKAALERLEPFFWWEQPFAAASAEAQMSSGGFIDPVTAVHFRDLIEAKGYKPVASRHHIWAEDAKKAREVAAQWIKDQREKANHTGFRFQSLRQAAATLSLMEYNEYCLSQEGQILMQRENASLR
jgi:hypothetical protein